MKKLLTVLTLMAFATTLTATAAESKLENFVNKKLAPVTQKEKDFNSKVEAQQKANAAKKAELQKQHEANKAALEKAKKDAQAKQASDKAKLEKAKKDTQAKKDSTKKAIENEKNYWKNLLK